MNLITSFLQTFNSSWYPRQEYFHDKIDYHPIHGQPGKVDRPKNHIKTYFGNQIPYIDRLNGPLDRHITSSAVYKQAWAERKRGSYYNLDLGTQISPYRNRPFQERRGDFIDGKKTSSRYPPQSRYRRTKYYETLKNGDRGFREYKLYQDTMNSYVK